MLPAPWLRGDQLDIKMTMMMRKIILVGSGAVVMMDEDNNLVSAAKAQSFSLMSHVVNVLHVEKVQLG